VVKTNVGISGIVKDEELYHKLIELLQLTCPNLSRSFHEMFGPFPEYQAKPEKQCRPPIAFWYRQDGMGNEIGIRFR
jgi:hypothetical protein